MPPFLIDEDLPIALPHAMRQLGSEVRLARECNLGGRSDPEIFQYAIANGMVVVTGDVGFSDLAEYWPLAHPGIVLVRYPNDISTSTLVQGVINSMKRIPEIAFQDNVIVLEPGRIRSLRDLH